MQYSRVLLKLSGEALAGGSEGIYDSEVLNFVVKEIVETVDLGVEVAIVVGAGNIIRGGDLHPQLGPLGLQKVTADQMGMLATLQNSLALRDLLEDASVPSQLFSAHGMVGTARSYSIEEASKALKQGNVVLCAGGTGNPLFTTDSAACLRGIELGVEVVVKATQVDGVYDSDPKVNETAKRFEQLTFSEVFERKLEVIDLTAATLCQENGMRLIVYRLASQGALAGIVNGSREGTLICP